MIKAAYIVPHPPLIVPEVGGERRKEIQKTIDAYEKVANEISELKPETIIYISPHSISYADYIHISGKESANGNFASFNAGNVSMCLNYDSELIREISGQAAENGVRAGTLGMRADSLALDHGVMVPEYFIDRMYTDYKAVRISISGLPRREHYKLGMCIQKAVQMLDRNCVIIASGDLSHKLKADGPYGFDKAGPEFDRIITEAMAKADFSGFLDMNEELCEAAAECGLRSFIIMSGALDSFKLETEFMTYEGPFGVGYAVCSYRVIGADRERSFLEKYKLTHEKKMNDIRVNEDEYVSLARKSLETFIQTGKKMNLPDGLSDDLIKKRAGAFVSIKKDGQLRGCVGTISATQSCIAEEIISNAISSGVRDNRFEPVEESELPELVYSVDILGDAEKISEKSLLDVKRYGVIVTSGFKRGLLLPNLEGVDTVEEQLSIALQKGGIRPDENYVMERFEVVRHK